MHRQRPFLSRWRAAKFVKVRNRPGLNGECHFVGAKSMSGLGTPFAHPIGTVSADGKELPADFEAYGRGDV